MNDTVMNFDTPSIILNEDDELDFLNNGLKKGSFISVRRNDNQDSTHEVVCTYFDYNFSAHQVKDTYTKDGKFMNSSLTITDILGKSK